jgi:hypothetical protein
MYNSEREGERTGERVNEQVGAWHEEGREKETRSRAREK